MAIVGAILGDISGSQFEFDKQPDLDWKNCGMFTDKCRFTDDTVMSLAVKQAIDKGLDYAESMRSLGRKYPDAGYGGHFYFWIFSAKQRPYNSYGNGAAMRVSYVGEHYENLDDVRREAERSASVSHDHPEGIKGAVVTASCVWMAKHGRTKQQIYDYVLAQYPPERYKFSIDKDIKYLEKNYSWDVTCMTSVPVAMRCFYESDSFETFMRNIFRLDCDSDTFGAIGGGVAEEFYRGLGFDPNPVLRRYLDEFLYSLL